MSFLDGWQRLIRQLVGGDADSQLLLIHDVIRVASDSPGCCLRVVVKFFRRVVLQIKVAYRCFVVFQFLLFFMLLDVRCYGID